MSSRAAGPARQTVRLAGGLVAFSVDSLRGAVQIEAFDAHEAREEKCWYTLDDAEALELYDRLKEWHDAR